MSNSKRFILVHGASHGSWCWQKLIPFLEELGHSALAVDLPGRAGKGHAGWRLSLQNYIDYEAYGRDLDMGGCFIETSRGMCEIPY